MAPQHTYNSYKTTLKHTHRNSVEKRSQLTKSTHTHTTTQKGNQLSVL